LAEKRLPYVWPMSELVRSECGLLEDYEPAMLCASFLEAKVALEKQGLVAFLPDFLSIGAIADCCVSPKVPAVEDCLFHYHLAWNPRLLRLNPHARRRRDALIEALAVKLAALSPGMNTKKLPGGRQRNKP